MLGSIKYIKPLLINVSSRNSVIRRIYSLSDNCFESYFVDKLVSIIISESRRSILTFNSFKLSSISLANLLFYSFSFYIGVSTEFDFTDYRDSLTDPWLLIEGLTRLLVDTPRSR